MEDSFDKEKIIECMFDPVTSEIIAELETDSKESTYLAEKVGITEDEISERLSYLIEHEFVKKSIENEKIIYSADAKKLGKVMETDGNFDSVTDGLTKMDSYLN